MVLKGKWRLDAVIGVGGMAAVFSATHRNGSRVAIKVLNPEYAAQPEFVARFMREGYVANKINHPSSVLVLDDDIDEGCAFLVMELLTGYSLERYARRNGRRLRLGQILHVADKVLDLLAVAHGHGILHRDIKPANIHVTSDGLVKVLDFGIARLAERVGEVAATQTGAALGTPSYMPPEQARGRWNMVDPRSDLWALGATVHALILGERPRRAETVQEEMLLAMTTPLTSLREAAPGTPPAVVAFLEKATAFEMDARFPDALTMQAALREVAAAAGVVAGVSVTGTIPPPSSAPNLGADPGSTSGPRVDTAGMVAPPQLVERDPMTLNATENTANPAPSPARSRAAIAVGVLAAAATVALGVGVRSMLRPRAPVDSFASASAAAPPTAAVTATAPVPSSPPVASVAPAPPPPTPTVTAPVPAASVAPVASIDDIDSVPPKPVASASPAPSEASSKATGQAVGPRPSTASEPRRTKPPPKPPAASALFDERF